LGAEKSEFVSEPYEDSKKKKGKGSLTTNPRQNETQRNH